MTNTDTTARAPTKDDRNQAMESEVHDVADVAHVTSQVWDLYRNEVTNFAALEGCTGPDLIEHMKSWDRSVCFMIVHLENLANKLLEHYSR
jgi:hypothetical protein